MFTQAIAKLKGRAKSKKLPHYLETINRFVPMMDREK